MANIIKEKNIKPDFFVSSRSRYLNSKVIDYSEKSIITFDIYKRINYIPNNTERLLLLTKKFEFRPDLLSNEIYGYSDNWWKILEVNKIHDIFDFVAGITILLPDGF